MRTVISKSMIPQLLLVFGFYVHGTSSFMIKSSSKFNTVSRPATNRQSTLSSTNIFANKFNVVLEPTIDNPTAFDSLKIGSAKVHRYTREGGPSSQDDEETQYVMWYHGRSVELAETNNKLPPLSTGRIGRATSRNGLVWKKQTSGSQSEDRSDVSLGLNKESWWGFDTTHVGLGTVMLPMSTPAVMTEGGVYLLYYMGGNGEESTLQDFLNNDVPADISEKTIQGMNMRIGVALSQDGITFGRVEGDDPTGAIVVPEKDELYCAWPEVLVNVGDSVPKPDSFIMYYSTMLKSTKQKCIAYATSADGFRWRKEQVCIVPSTDTHYDAAGVARCYVHQDAVYNKGTWIEIPNAYTMYYEGVSSLDNKHRIMKAISTDGKKWTKAGLVLDVGTEDSWDCNGVGAPHIIRLDDGSSRMYYSGQGQNGSTAIGVAKDADGSGNWVREQATISLSS